MAYEAVGQRGHLCTKGVLTHPQGMPGLGLRDLSNTYR